MSTATVASTGAVVPKSLPEVLTLAEAAEYLRVSESDVLDLATKHGLPGRKIGDQWRFLRAALQDWLRSPLLQKERLRELAGAWKDDPYLDDMLEQIYKERGRPMTEEADT